MEEVEEEEEVEEVDIMKVKRMDKNSEEEVEEDKEEDTIQEIETDKNLEEEEEEELEDRTLLMKENIIKISKMMVNNKINQDTKMNIEMKTVVVTLKEITHKEGIIDKTLEGIIDKTLEVIIEDKRAHIKNDLISNITFLFQFIIKYYYRVFILR